MIWALERDAVADLLDGPVTIERDDVAVTLEVTDEGDPLLTVERAGKRLKNVPKSHAKDPGFAALKARAKDLRTQASRVRDTLETAMVAGDLFEARELAELLAHPILAPRFRALVWTTNDGARMGYPDAEARTLSGPGGASHDLEPEDEVRIAHPTDLFASQSWAAWQRDCFEVQRTQPIKQVFRELYPLTESERGEAKSTARYAGTPAAAAPGARRPGRARLGLPAGGRCLQDVPRRGPRGAPRLRGGLLHACRRRGSDPRQARVHAPREVGTPRARDARTAPRERGPSRPRPGRQRRAPGRRRSGSERIDDRDARVRSWARSRGC